jgi:hypothetical protein
MGLARAADQAPPAEGVATFAFDSYQCSHYTQTMSKRRLQVILAEDEYREIERHARAQRMTVSEWVRRSLRRAGRSEPLVDADRKLESVRAAARHAFPTADIEQMLQEIERGYLGGAA